MVKSRFWHLYCFQKHTKATWS